MGRIAVFSGQGAQAVGMGRALFDAIAEARAVFEEVDAALDQRLSTIIFDGPQEMLTLTANAQPALMATSLAAVRALEARAGQPLAGLVDLAAGHSLGEYSALAAMGALSIADAARLLRIRGEAMQAAVPVGEGAMAAIMGLAIEAVEAVAAEASAGGDTCDVANDNSEGQIVVSGSAAGVAHACELAKARGAKRALPLPVSAPFHSRLMQPAAERLAEALARTSFSAPARPILANILAEPVADPGRFADLLERQVTGRVRWRESMAWMAGHGISDVVEIGAGKVLTGLARRAVPGATMVNLATPEDIDAFVEGLEARSGESG